MIRAAALQAVGGYREDVIAAEEDELSVRLRQAKWRIWRLGDEMALHDAAMLHFRQWWRRTLPRRIRLCARQSPARRPARAAFRARGTPRRDLGTVAAPRLHHRDDGVSALRMDRLADLSAAIRAVDRQQPGALFRTAPASLSFSCLHVSRKGLASGDVLARPVAASPPSAHRTQTNSNEPKCMTDSSTNRRAAVSAPQIPFARPSSEQVTSPSFTPAPIREAKGVELAATCDPNLGTGEVLCQGLEYPAGVRIAGRRCLQDAKIDCVHILTPPDLHFSLAKAALEAGVHVFLEKPMCTSGRGSRRTGRTRGERGLYLGVSHNFLFSAAFQRLREVVQSKALGPIDHITFNHFYELGQIRFGPFDSWMLRDPGNVMLETGPHLVSALLDLVGEPERVRRHGRPEGELAERRGDTIGAGACGATGWAAPRSISTSTSRPGFPQRTIYVRGLFGAATARSRRRYLRDRPAHAAGHRPRPLSSAAASIARQTAHAGPPRAGQLCVRQAEAGAAGNPYQNSIQDQHGRVLCGDPQATAARCPHCRPAWDATSSPQCIRHHRGVRHRYVGDHGGRATACRCALPPPPSRRCWCSAAPASSARS